MDWFWVLTYIDDNDQIRRQRYRDDEEARDAWNSGNFSRRLFLDEVRRIESDI